MLLNLRGMIGQNTSHDHRSRSGIQDRRHLHRNKPPETPSRSNTVADMRTRSNLSHVSDDHHGNTENTPATIKRYKRMTPLSATLSESSSINIAKPDTSFTQPITVMTNKNDSKKLIKWKDMPTGNTYWQVLELNKDDRYSISNAVDIKPIALVQQTKVLKFDKSNKDPAVPPVSPASGASKSEEKKNTPRESIFNKFSGGTSIAPKTVRFSKARYYENMPIQI